MGKIMKVRFLKWAVISMCVFASGSGFAQIDTGDSLALVDLYNSTDGPNWTNNTNWLTPQPVATWHGILDAGTRVLHIDLGTNNLNGQIPTTIGDLDSLNDLTIGANPLLIGPIPVELTTLSSLNILTMNDNGFTGAIPAEFGNLTSLQALGLQGNQFSGSIPVELGNLTNLVVLYLQDNLLSGTIPAELGNLPNLLELDLTANQLTGTIPSALGNLSSLQYLNLSRNDIIGSIPTEFGNLTNLANLQLFSNQLSGPLPVELGNLSNLQFFILSDNLITGTIPPELGNLTNLTSFQLHLNQLTGTIPPELGTLTNLVEIYLNDNSLSGSIPPELGNFSNLGVMQLQNNSLSGAVPPEFNNLTNLISLTIQNNQLVDLPTLSAVSGLSTLRIQNNQFTFEDIEPNLGPSIFTYSPQDSVGNKQNIISTVGSPFDISVTVGGANNLYQWFKDDILIPGATGATYSIPVIDFPDAGVYTCQITNSLATALTLHSRPVSLTVVTSELEQDSLALVDLYNSTDGANWVNNTNWLSSQPISTWFGISMAGPRVGAIFLTVNGLNGQLPATLGSLDSLAGLVIDGNPLLTGPIPASIGSLTALDDLFLASNRLSGPIPPELGDLQNLRFFALSGNLNLSGTIPTELTSLTNLETFELGDNALTGAIPPGLGNLTNLTKLTLGVNQLTGQIPTELANLINLEILALERNQLDGGIPAELGNLSKLRELILFDNPLTGSIPSGIDSLTSLERLEIYNCQLTGTIPPEIGNLLNLRILNVSNNSLTGTLTPELFTLDSLEILSLFSNQISGTIPSEVGNLSNLFELDLSLNQLTGSIPPEIGNLSNLDRIYLPINQLSGPIPPEIGNLSNLRRLHIHGNQFSGNIPPEIGNLTNLLEIFMGFNSFTGTVPPELGNLTGIAVLSFPFNSLSGAIPPEFNNLTNLAQLYIHNNQLVDLPALDALTTLSILEIQENQFTFEDIEPNLGPATFVYAPQANFGAAQDTVVNINEPLIISVTVGGTNNQYQWYFGNTLIPGATNSTYSIPSAGPQDAGIYYCEVTNTVATELTLASNPITVLISDPATEPFTINNSTIVTQETGSHEGLSWTDFNGDGFADLYVSRAFGQDNSLYFNNGDNTFSLSGGVVSNDGGSSRAGIWGDYDNDGLLDLFVADNAIEDGSDNNRLYHATVLGEYEKITSGIVVEDIGNSHGSAWGDYDNDGDIDLFLANAGISANSLFRNDGAGNFTKITSGDIVNDIAESFGCNWVDYDNDGDIDLFVANSAAADPGNSLYRNNLIPGGDTTFTKIAAGDLTADTDGSFGGSWADYDNDGDFDLYITNILGNRLYRNDGDGNFTSQLNSAVVGSDTVLSFGSSWADYDNDGDLDLFVSNSFTSESDYLFRNELIPTGSPDFTQIVNSVATAPGISTVSNAWGDYNRDGFLDLFVTRNGGTNFLFENIGNNNSWIDINLVGVYSNYAGIGAVVEAKATINGNPVWQTSRVSSQTGFQGQNDLNVAFGLGDAIVVDSLVIEWPSGTLQILTDLPVNTFLPIVEQQITFSSSPTALVFDTLGLGATADQTITLTNTGDGDLIISETQIAGVDTAAFSIVAGGGADTLTQAAGKDITIRFSSITDGDKNAFLVLRSNAALYPDSISISGTVFKDTVIVPPPPSPPAGSPVDIVASPPQTFTPTTSLLFYRRTGEPAYQSQPLTESNGNFIAAIPSDYVTVRGVEYYVSHTDGSNTATFPELLPEINPAVLQVTIASTTTEVPIDSAVYAMISIPLELSNTDVFSVLGNNYGEYDRSVWRILRWEASQAAYTEFPDLNGDFSSGNAFWLITADSLPFDVQNGQSVNSSQPFTISLQPGWNQIGNPYAFNVNWNNVENTSAIQQPVFWNGDSYEFNQTTLVPWDGYFVFNTSANAVDIAIQAVESNSPAPKQSLWAQLLSHDASSDQEFILQITAEGQSSGWRDDQNYAGMLTTATNELDSKDFLEPPPISDNIQLSFTKDEYLYAGNFVSISPDGAYWDMQLTTSGKTETVSMMIETHTELPPDFQIWLLDRNRQTRIPVSEGRAAVTVPENGKIKQMRLIAGKESFAESNSNGIPLIPIEYGLSQNFPNPFNPETTIQYQLAEVSTVELTIYNVRGQRIRTLRRGEQSTGVYSVLWDGRDDAGSTVASGMYIYRLKANEFVKTKKMILIR